MAKAAFHKNQKVFVKPVGTWAVVEAVLPQWVKGLEEPLKIHYDVGLGREFSASELVADKGHSPVDDVADFDNWRISRARNRWKERGSLMLSLRQTSASSTSDSTCQSLPSHSRSLPFSRASSKQRAARNTCSPSFSEVEYAMVSNNPPGSLIRPVNRVSVSSQRRRWLTRPSPAVISSQRLGLFWFFRY